MQDLRLKMTTQRCLQFLGITSFQPLAPLRHQFQSRPPSFRFKFVALADFAFSGSQNSALVPNAAFVRLFLFLWVEFSACTADQQHISLGTHPWSGAVAPHPPLPPRHLPRHLHHPLSSCRSHLWKGYADVRFQLVVFWVGVSGSFK